MDNPRRAVLSQRPYVDFLLLTNSELAALREQAQKKHPDQAPLTEISRDEILELLKDIDQRRLLQEEQALKEKLADKLLEQRAEQYAKDIDLVRPSGKIRLYVGEGTHELYSHPAILEAVKRVHKRNVIIQVSAGPFLSSEQKGDRKICALVQLARKGRIQLYRRSTRGYDQHFALLETDQGLRVRLEKRHLPGVPSDEREMVEFESPDQERKEGERMAKVFDASLATEGDTPGLIGLEFSSWDDYRVCIELLMANKIEFDFPPGEKVVFIPSSTSHYVQTKLKEQGVPFRAVKVGDSSELSSEELVELRKKYL